MKKTVLLVVVTFALWSCGASQPARVYGNKNIETKIMEILIEVLQNQQVKNLQKKD